MSKLPFKVKARVAARSVIGVMKKPLYLSLGLVGAGLMLGLVLWSLNIELLIYVLFQSEVSLGQKLRFFSYVYEVVFTQFSVQNFSFLVFSALFGINLAMLTYVVRNRQSGKAAITSSGSAAVFGMLSGGCAACGTSLLTPVLASFGGASAGLLEGLGAFLSLIGSLLILYALYNLGQIASFSLATEK